MAKYKFTYFLNTTCAERRPQTRRDLIKDWIVEEREYPLDLEAFEYAFINILDGDEDELDDIYEELPDQDDLTKINRLKEIFDEEARDLGMGNTILISLEGPGQTYDSGYTKEEFLDNVEDEDEDYDDNWEDLEESKKLTENNDKLEKIAKEQVEFDHNNAGDYFLDLVTTLDKNIFIKSMLEEDEGGMMNEYNLSYEEATKVYGLIYDLLSKKDLEESKDSDEDEEELEDAVQELMDTLIDLTDDCSWDVNDIYDNCVILEGDFEDDYIEVFVYLDENGKKHYTINDEGEDIGTKYYSIEDVVKNLPGLKKDYSQEIYYWEGVLLDLEKHGDWNSEEHENAQSQLNHFRNLQHSDEDDWDYLEESKKLTEDRNLKYEFDNLSKQEKAKYLELRPENRNDRVNPKIINSLAQKYNLDKDILYYVINIRSNIEESKKLTEDYDDEIKVYMNTWKNYNEYGADLVLYDNIDGWMSIEEAKKFAELHNDDEPFINDTENCPIKVSEYDNCMKILEDLEAYEDCDDKEVLTAILESENVDIQNALEILNSGDYIFFSDIDNDEDLAHAYIDMIGGLDSINNKEDYIDENAYRESWREIAEDTIREEQPDLDEDSKEFEDVVEKWLNIVYPEQLALAIENNSKDLEDYFDYEAYGRDLSFEYFYASTGAISIL